MNKIKAMLSLQQELNDSTNGTGWEKGITKNRKQIDWRRCIWLEAAELVESYPWKHWKSIDAQPDYANIKIEAVDIWHFVMSEALRVWTLEKRGGIVDLAHTITSTDVYRDFVSGKTREDADIYQQVEAVEKLVEMLFSRAPIEAWTAQFYRVALQSGLDLDALYQLYIGKNILNRFRQNHGYKEGTYIKVWNAEEDNVIMQRLLESRSDMSPEELYQGLERAYPAS